MKRFLHIVIPGWRDQRGAALPLALMVLAVLGTMSAAILSIGSSEVQISGNHLRATQTHFVAEAGLEDAFNTFRNNPSLLVAGPDPNPAAVPGLSGPGTKLTAFGTYTVQYKRAGVNTVQVISEGTSAAGGARKVLRATLSNAFVSGGALVVGKDLYVSGNPQVKGTCGSVHANRDVDISGSPVVSGSFTAHKKWTYKKGGSIGGDFGGDRPKKDIPPIRPSDFLYAAKALLPADQVFQMMGDGRVLDGNDNLITIVPVSDDWRGWKYTPGIPKAKWEHVKNTSQKGTYYIQGHAMIADNPGTKSDAWKATVIATGDILVSGNAVMTPHLSGTALVAGLDLKISGNPDQILSGFFGAHEQVDISGNPVLNGYILAEDVTSTSDTVKEAESYVSGNLDLTYDCNLNVPLGSSLSILSWGL